MQTWPSLIIYFSILYIYFKSVQDAVDILDSLLDPRNDMSFQEITTQVHAYHMYLAVRYICVDIYNA